MFKWKKTIKLPLRDLSSSSRFCVSFRGSTSFCCWSMLFMFAIWACLSLMAICWLSLYLDGSWRNNLDCIGQLWVFPKRRLRADGNSEGGEVIAPPPTQSDRKCNSRFTCVELCACRAHCCCSANEIWANKGDAKLFRCWDRSARYVDEHFCPATDDLAIPSP